MRGTPLRDGPTSNWARVCGACALAIAGLWLASVAAVHAEADTCANAEFRSGPSEHLPDCRAYEQVSPVDKGGLDAVTLSSLLPAQSSACEPSESCTIAYVNISVAFAGAPSNEFGNAYVATRAREGWQTTSLSPPTSEAPGNSFAKVAYAFSGDLSQAVLRVPLQQLTEGAPAGVYNLYIRRPDGSYSLVTASAPPEPPQSGCGRCFESQDVAEFAGASNDFSHVIFEANDSLTAGAPGGGVESLYETVAEHVRDVGVLPDGVVDPKGAMAGGGIEANGEHMRELDNAISSDGLHVVFEAAADGGEPDPQQAGDTEVYDRIDGSSTVEVSAPAPGAQPSRCETADGICAPEPAEFWDATEDGSAVYFTSKAALTRESNTGPEERSEAEEEEEEETGEPIGDDLYRYDVATGRLTDLTVDKADPDGATVLGVVGASQDGTYVYFVASGALAAGATSGMSNLYVWHEATEGKGTVSFIAMLASPSAKEQANIEAMRVGSAFHYHSDVLDWTSRPMESQAYVTPDGRHLAFMSVEPLTGYDNQDQTTEEADHEVFEYSAETGQLVCASCDPGGTRPLGSAFIGAKLDERVSTPFHQPRSLSDDGSRVFFSSPDPLVPGLVAGSVRVFEYEQGAPLLISGLEGNGESVFLDASASGDDAFIATRERLAPTDADELLDVYDVRVDGGLPSPVIPASCAGGACREPFGTSPTLATPASATLTGVGNLVPAQPAKPAPTRKQLLARALARCRKLRSRTKRSACIAAAKRRYGPVAGRHSRGVATRRRSRG